MLLLNEVTRRGDLGNKYPLIFSSSLIGVCVVGNFELSNTDNSKFESHHAYFII